MALDAVNTDSPIYLDADFVASVESGAPFNENDAEPVVLSGAARALVESIERARKEAGNPNSQYAKETRIATLSNLWSELIVPAQRVGDVLPLHALVKDGEGISFEAHRMALKKEIEALTFSNIYKTILGKPIPLDRTLHGTFQAKANNFVEACFSDIVLDDVKTEPTPDIAA